MVTKQLPGSVYSPDGSLYITLTDGNGNLVPASGTGTVTSVSVVNANGVSGTVATPSTTPAITLSLGNITPTAITASTVTVITTETFPDGSTWGVTGASSVSAIAINPSPGVPGGVGFVVYANQGAVNFSRAEGTPTSPASLTAGGVIGVNGFLGYNGTSFINKARFLVLSSETGSWTTSANGTVFEFDTTASGSTTRTQAMRIGSGVIVGNSTLDPGNGQIATAGYTVTSLPASVTGARAYVTDALAPTFLGLLTGGGTTKSPVFYNGTAWIVG
jgi:hypothetical protein